VETVQRVRKSRALFDYSSLALLQIAQVEVNTDEITEPRSETVVAPGKVYQFLQIGEKNLTLAKLKL